MQKITCNCDVCPLNMNFGETSGDYVYPCGQQNCWDELDTEDEEEEEEYDW